MKRDVLPNMSREQEKQLYEPFLIELISLIAENSHHSIKAIKVLANFLRNDGKLFKLFVPNRPLL